MYSPNRRDVIAAGAAFLLTTVPARSRDRATRSYKLFRGGSDIGTHKLSIERDGDRVIARTNIDIAVKVLGFTAYRYELAYTETYRDGVLQTLNGTANDDGDPGFVNVTRKGNMLEVDGSSFSDLITGTAAPTSYWRQQALNTTPWISTQTGEILRVGTTEVQPLTGFPAGTRSWRASNNADYSVDIAYDAQGNWLGCSFDARGELVTYNVEGGSGALASLAI